jgi:hypothetical protein
MEDDTYYQLSETVQFKMFFQENMGKAMLFIMYEELGNEEMRADINAHYVGRYTGISKSSTSCWSKDLVCYAAYKAIERCDSRLLFNGRWDTRELFYLTFGEDLDAKLTDIPEVGHIVLLPNSSKSLPKIGVVSRVLLDETGKINKWWYIAGNTGVCVSQVREVKGNLKKTEGFMDISRIIW